MKISILHDKRVLVLNRNWQAIAIISPAEAFAHMATGNADGLDIEDGESMMPVKWPDWRELEVRHCDGEVGTAHGAVRVPTVIVLREYAQVPLHRPKFSLRNLWLRDEGRCQYSGRKLTAEDASIDHVIPRSRGGETSWENCVLSERRLNSIKGARTPKEAGLYLLNTPVEPRPIPVTLTLKNHLGLREWDLFLVKLAA